MKDKTFSGQDYVSVTNVLIEPRRAWHFPRTHEAPNVWFFKTFMSGTTLLAIMARLTLFSKYAKLHECTTMKYVRVIIYLSRRYDTDAVISKADRDIRNYIQGPLTAWNLSQKLWDLPLRCGSSYNDLILRTYFEEGIDLISRSTLGCRWADIRDATLEELSHDAQSVLICRGGQLKSATKHGPRSKVALRSTKDLKG